MSILELEQDVLKINNELRNYTTEQMIDWLAIELYSAFAEARRGKTRTVNEQKFEEDRDIEIARLAREIVIREYEPARSVAFVITEPTPREIFAASFRDRIVHHFLIQKTGDFWDKRLSPRSFSCRNGKGTLYGIRKLEDDMREVSDNWQSGGWVMKIDLRGYFMSLPREYLFDRVAWGLDRQFPDGGPLKDMCEYLWMKVLFDNPLDGVRLKGELDDWNMLPRSKSMFYSREGRGIVIGNLTSQWVSNMALDPLDRYVHFDLGFKHYGRYVDDAYFVAKTKDELLTIRPKIEKFVSDIGLTIHPKKFYLQRISSGVPFLGVVIYPNRTVIGKRFKRNTGRLYASLQTYGFSDRKIRSIGSYFGLASHYKHKKTLYDIFGRRNIQTYHKWR